MKGKLIKGKDLKGKVLFRLTNENECHHGFQYETGVNTDTLPFNDSIDEDCVVGGLYFTNTEDIISFMYCETRYLREVFLNDDEPVVKFEDKYRAHSIILGERADLTKSSTWEHLAECGVDIHAYDDEAIRWAACNGYLEVVKFLIEQGADTHACDDALRWAACNGYLEVVKFLTEQGANIHACDNDDDCALSWAACNGRFKVVEYLVERGADIHAHNDGALRGAVYNGRFKVIQYLIEHGADIHAEDDLALKWATRNGYKEVVKYLKSL